ncbi:MAG: bifunctional glycosyltransferase/class I SAM-dependent methyltransferase, partial [Deltaproteobacteria bacterium]
MRDTKSSPDRKKNPRHAVVLLQSFHAALLRLKNCWAIRPRPVFREVTISRFHPVNRNAMNSFQDEHTNSAIESYDAIETLLALKREQGDAFPHILVLVTAYKNADLLAKTLERVPRDLLPLVSEVAVFDNFSPDKLEDGLARVNESGAWKKLRFFRNPRRYDYGDNLKVCFDYAVDKKYEYVIVLRGDGLYDPACLPAFFLCALKEKAPVVFGDRLGGGDRQGTRDMRYLRVLVNRVASSFEDAILRMKLRDYFCGFRLFRTDVLERIPYHLNSSDYLFDLETLIQVRCLGIPVRTVRVTPFHDREISVGRMIRYGIRAAGISIGYRLHQLHILRRGTYFVDLGEKYTLKRNRHSSHMQILDAIPRSSRVLDLGCGQSLLAEEFARKDVLLIGVDKLPEDHISAAIHQYVRRDLEEPLNLPFGREFDYVVVSDLIEHIKNRDAIMESLRRFLKLNGRLIISTGNVAIWFYRLSLLIGRFEYGARGILDRTHVHLFTFDSFERFLKRNGYRIIERKTTPIPFELVFSSTGRSRALNLVTRWYH